MKKILARNNSARLKIIALIHIAISAMITSSRLTFGVLFGLASVFMLLSGTIPQIIIGFVLVIVNLLFFLSSVAGIAGGIGIFFNKSWAKRLMFISLMGVPLFILLSVIMTILYSWVFVKPMPNTTYYLMTGISFIALTIYGIFVIKYLDKNLIKK
jgi:hypothetical protein